MDIKVSIIIPVYNAERFLAEGLESLKKQTLKEIEIVMVNDGSKDRSKKICQTFQQNDSRFILINQENGGSAAARKTGMLAAHGEYLGFMDADDWCEPNMFEKLYNTAKENDSDIVFCNCYRDFPDHSIKCNKYLRNGAFNRQEILQDILSRSLAGLDDKGRNHVIRWANYLRIYRHELIEKYQIYNDPRFRRCQDLQLTFEATLYAQRYYYLGDEYLYHNRVVDDSQSRGYTKDCWKKLRILIEKLYDDVDNFKEIDLHNQMDLCTFFFTIYTIENECRDISPLILDERKEKLCEICYDPIISKSIKGVDRQKLSNINQKYYDALNNKSIDEILKAYSNSVAYEKKQIFKSRILNIPCVKKIYKIIRHIFEDIK